MSAPRWYRFDDKLVSSGIDEDGDCVGPGYVVVNLYSFEVVKETAKGAWLWAFGERRFALRDPNGKRFAYETKEGALAGFVARKNRQISILSSRLRNAKEAKELALNGHVGGLGNACNLPQMRPLL